MEKLNFKSFIDEFIFYPTSKKLPKEDQKKALITSIGLGILFFGIVHGSIAVFNLVRFRGRITKNVSNDIQGIQRVSKEQFSFQAVDCLKVSQLVAPKEVKKLNCHELLYELCEIDLEGNFRECSQSRMQEILNYLKEKEISNILNSVPEYYYGLPRINYINYTPLNYWIKKGDLQAVKLLVEHGASTRTTEAGSKDCPKNGHALYQAAISGKIDIVKYLLEKGEGANIAFRHDPFLYFIPTFIFDLSSRLSGNPKKSEDFVITCLEEILASLNKNELTNQFKIPVAKFNNRNEPLNSISWVKQLTQRSNNQDVPITSLSYKRLIQLMEKYDATENCVYTMEEMYAMNKSNTSLGCTLDELARLK